MEQWYAVRTKARAEKRVAARLEERGYEVFLPIITDDQKNGTRHPLFPTYLFLNINLQSAKPANWQRVPGLHYLVGYGENPVPVPDHVIRAIAHQMAGRNAAGPARKFQQGDLVRIKEGPFKDLLGVFDVHLSANDRVQILLQTMQRSIRVTVNPDSLAKEPASAEQSPKKKKRPRRTRGRGRPIRRS